MSTWRLSAILTSLCALPALDPLPLPPLLNSYYSLARAGTPLSAHSSAWSSVNLLSLKGCAPPGSRDRDPFLPSSVLMTADTMTDDDMATFNNLFRSEDGAPSSSYLKATLQVTTTHPSSSQPHIETVDALIEVSPHYPLVPPLFLLTSRSLGQKGEQLQTSSRQVDNVLKVCEACLSA